MEEDSWCLGRDSKNASNSSYTGGHWEATYVGDFKTSLGGGEALGDVEIKPFDWVFSVVSWEAVVVVKFVRNWVISLLNEFRNTK